MSEGVTVNVPLVPSAKVYSVLVSSNSGGTVNSYVPVAVLVKYSIPVVAVLVYSVFKIVGIFLPNSN